MNTYLVRTYRPDMNAKGGQREIRWLVRAEDHLSAGVILPGASFAILDQGPHLDAQAEALGILDGGAVEV